MNKSTLINIRFCLMFAVLICISLTTMFMLLISMKLDSIKVIQKEFSGQCVINVSDVMSVNTYNIENFLGCVVGISGSILNSSVVISRDTMIANSIITTAPLHFTNYFDTNILTAEMIINNITIFFFVVLIIIEVYLHFGKFKPSLPSYGEIHTLDITFLPPPYLPSPQESVIIDVYQTPAEETQTDDPTQDTQFESIV